MIPYHRIASRLYNQPLLITPNVADTISSYVLGRIRSHQDLTANGSTDERVSSFLGDRPRDEATGARPPYRIADGIAVITIDGELVNRGAWVGSDSGLVSYEGIKYQLQTALADSRVKSILLDIESPGGEAVGAFDAAAAIRAAASQKPVVAFVNGLAASGGYALASGASRIVSIPEGRSGSIGVLMMHVDASAALMQEGLKPTYIFAGAHKVDGNPFEAMPKDVQARFQAEINKTYSMFVSSVAAGRTNMTEDAIRATEAKVFTGQDALDVGLIDAIGTLDDVLGEMKGMKSGSVSPKKRGPAARAAVPEDSKMSLMEKLKALMSAEAEESTPLTAASDVPQPTAAGTVSVVDGGTDFAAIASENARLKADLAKRDADVKTANLARNAAQIQTFMGEHGSKMGQSYRTEFESLYTSAKNGTLEASAFATGLESLAAALPIVGAPERVKVETGKIDAAAAKVSGDSPDAPHATHFEALKRLDAAGVKKNDPAWSVKYPAMLDAITKENAGAQASASA